METENKYKTFGELKVGDEIIAVDETTNNKYVYEVYGTEKNIDFIDAECVALNIIKINPIDERSSINSITFCVDDYVATYSYKTFISDADNADEIIKRTKEKCEQEEKSKQLESIREQARKNPPRFITLNHEESYGEFVINVDAISLLRKRGNHSIVSTKENILYVVDNDYEEIKAMLGL